LRTLDWVPFRGLIRGSALEKTSGLLLSDFDPLHSHGTEHRFMAELALLGEFRFVEGPTYLKSWHGGNLSIERAGWSREHFVSAYACYAAWMIEVIVPAGASARQRRRLLRITLDRFAGRQDPFKWIRFVVSSDSKALAPLRMIRDQLKKSEKLSAAVQAVNPAPLWCLKDISITERSALLSKVFKQLKSGRRFDPHYCLNMSWGALESEILRQAR
jgi:hypothetical protein